MSIVISGVGVVSPAGCTLDEYWTALCNPGDNTRSHMGAYPVSSGGALTAQISPETIRSLAKALQEVVELPPHTEVAELYLLAATVQALKGANLFETTGRSRRVGVIIGNLEPNSRAFDLQAAAEISNSNSYSIYRSSNLSTSIKRLLPGIKIEMTVHNTCASANAALEIGKHLVDEDLIDTAIIGATEAFSERIFAGFSALGVVGNEPCRPFSKRRRFVTISEGAGVLVLQRAKAVSGLPAAELKSVSSSNDAYHPTNPLKAGIRRAVTAAYGKAHIAERDVDCIFAHGTGSRANDEAEASLFMDLTPRSAITAIKGTIGHSMGAAGAHGLVAACLTAVHGRVPPTNISRGELEYDIDLVTNEPRLIGPRAIIQNNAFGFGGLNTVAVLQRMGDQ